MTKQARGYRPAGATQLHIVPITFPAACAFVSEHHRHHTPPQGHKLSFGVATTEGRLVGVAIVGRPVSRILQNGSTVEATRVATDGTPNACSALLAAAWRTFRPAGYRRLITYIQEGETGISLHAAGMRQVAVLPPRGGWDTPSRPRTSRGTEQIGRQLWEFVTADAPPLPDELWRDVTRNETPPSKRRCAVCRNPLHLPPTGRPPRYCSPACRQVAHRARQSGRRVSSTKS
ncbi:XF1762 family protein [Nonomuraea sp. NPDC004297]